MSGDTRNAPGSAKIRPTDRIIVGPPDVCFRCEVVATSRQGVVDQLVEILQLEGFYVSKRVAWEKVGAFRKRVGLDHRMFHKILAHPSCPPVELFLGSGRKQVLAINPNPLFESFARAVKGKSPETRK